MTCARCGGTLDYVHGHAACLNSRCPMYGLNQNECCSGETAACTAEPSPTRPAPAV